MTLALDAGRLRQMRLRAQGLSRLRAGLTELPAQVCSLQAQDYNAAVLGVRVRSRGLLAEHVRAALNEGQLAWTWLMRGTLHFCAPADLPWMLPLLGPEFIRQTSRRYRELGLDETTRRRATSLLRQILADGPQTRAALKDRLEAEGLPAEGQACPHLLRHAALEGALLCLPPRGSRPDYRLLPQLPAEAWPGREAAAARLARRYLRAFGPADASDFARWSGLPASRARPAFAALGDELRPVEAAGRPAFLLGEQLPWLEETPQRSLHLLPAFDSLLLGHVDRTLILPQEISRRIHPGGGIIRPALLLDGVTRGAWQLKRGRRNVTLIVTPFAELPRTRLSELEAEVADIGRFLGRPAILKLEPAA